MCGYVDRVRDGRDACAVRVEIQPKDCRGPEAQMYQSSRLEGCI
jgi:hypothetical protein